MDYKKGKKISKYALQISLFLDKALNIIYPRRCPICGGIVKEYGENACIECKKELLYTAEPVCKKCGKQVSAFEEEYCFDCTKKHHVFESGAALYIYNNAIKNAIYGFKYHNKREYAKFFGDEISKHLEDKISEWNIEKVIAVPLHKKKKRIRGYNQAELIAKHICRNLDIEYVPNAIERVRFTVPQKELTSIERKKNLEKAFKICKDSVLLINKNVLLIDDIYTTGSTIDECTKVLLSSGVSSVHYISLSIGTGV